MENIEIICGYLAWIGGDVARFTISDLSKLGLDANEVEESLQFLEKLGFIRNVRGIFTPTKKGSFAIDFSLFSIIAKWGYKSAIWSPYPFETLQWLFIRSEKEPLRNMLWGIKSRYVLNFCQKFLSSLVKLVPGYSMKDYSSLRDFVLRTSLCPEYSFATSQLNNDIKNVVSYLCDKKIISTFEAPEKILAFNIKELEIYGTKQKNQEKAK